MWYTSKRASYRNLEIRKTAGIAKTDYRQPFAWLNKLPASSGTKLTRAVQYCLNEKSYLCRCADVRSIRIDNNRAGNAI